MMLATERDSSLPAGAVVLDVGKRLDRLLAQRLPRLEQLCGDLQRQAGHWGGAALERALLAHGAALDALDFSLLVAPGLRAGPLERHEAAFRRQAAAVADCTEVTWGAVKDFVEASAREAVEAEALASDFVMEARAIQRQAAEARTTGNALVADVHAREAAAGAPDSRQAWAALALKASALLQRIARIEEACASSHRVQSGTYRLRDERVALVGSLKALAQGLGGGLLERLRPLIGPSHHSAADDLGRAEAVLHELRLALQDALAHLQRLQAGQAAVAAALAGMQQQAGALR